MSSKGDIKIDIEKYKHNPDYRNIIQNRFKDDLVQPYKPNGEKNPEFIKRFGEDFYKPKKNNVKEEILNEQEERNNNRKRITLGRGRGSKFA